MGFLSNLLGRTSPQNAIALDETSELFRRFAVSYATHAGVSVTSDSAVASVAVLACLIVRAESIMLCPVDVYKKDGKARAAADDHPAAKLIADEPNPFMSAEEFWRWKQITEDLRGNAYARVVWFAGKPLQIWPMYGSAPTIKIGGDNNQTMVYRYGGDETTPAGDYPASEIMHFKGPLLSSSPYKARSLIEVTAETIGLGIASEQFFARFLGNGSHFPNYLYTDDKLTTDDMEALRKQVDSASGLFEAGKIRVFDRGLKVGQNQMSLKDADLSGQQRWILEQVCRTFRVPLPMVQDLTHGTYTNSEQADLWLSKYTATPILRNSEGVLRRRLLLPSERRTHYMKFNVNAMMRGDFTTRTAGYSVLINCGVLSPNEARALEDWNPYDGGDEYRVPLNTEPAGSDPFDPTPSNGWQATPKPAQAGLDGLTGSSTPAHAIAPVLGDAKARIETRTAENIKRGRSRDDSLTFAEKVLKPIADSAAALGLNLDPTALAEFIVDEVTAAQA